MKKLLVIICLTFSVVSLWGQQLEQNSLYYFNPLNYNPAYAGSHDVLSITALHRIQWVGIDGAPNTTFLTAHSPIRNTHLSVGGDLTYDEIGVSNTVRANLDVSYYIQLNDEGHRLSFALKGGVNRFDADLMRLVVRDEHDELQRTIDGKLKPNFGAGIYYYGTHHYIGFSALSLLNHDILVGQKENGDSLNAFEQKRHFYLMGGYVFDLSSSLKLKPSGLIKAVAGAPVEFDAELAALIYDRLWVGLGYRHQESVRAYLTAYITPQLRIGYNYDYIFNDLTKYTGGTHEFMISYDFDYDHLRFKSPRYF